MKRRLGRFPVALGLCAAVLSPSLAAESGVEQRLEALERKVQTIDERSGVGKSTQPERRLEAAAGVGEEAYVPPGTAPSAGTVYRVDNEKVSLAGYGEAVYQNFSNEKENGTPSGRKDTFDLLRLVAYLGYRFNDKILFNSEIEYEHASSGKRGEVSVEFAYLDFLLSRPFGVRAGMVLVPMGFTNELHEPTVFHGSLRPDIEQNIIPTTWRENGAGFFGQAGPFSYRAYVVAALQAARQSATDAVGGFRAANGLRGGRSSGSASLADDFAAVGRLDYQGIPGFLLGASAYTGKTGQRVADPVSGEEIGAHVTLWDIHSEWESHGAKIRGLYTRATIGDVAKINNANGLTGNASVGEALWGGYVEGSYDVLPLVLPDTNQSLSPFVRYERYNTQDGVPNTFTENPASNRTVVTFGLTYKPIDKVAIKADYQDRRDKADTAVDQFNLALGWRF